MSSLLSYWQWHWASAILVAAIALCYISQWQHMATSQRSCFTVAISLLIICLFSPLQVLASQYLFSIHMLVHVLLLLIVAPLLVLSLPKNKTYKLSEKLFQHPWWSWLIGVGIMWVWHLPWLFNNVMHAGNEYLQLLETVSLLVCGMLFSWPVIGPNKQYRIAPLTGVVYLFTACVFCSLLGLLITFAPSGIYHHYLSSDDVYGLNNVIRNDWGITQSDDQQAAGLIMWVPCCMVYVAASMYLLKNWFDEKEETKDMLPLNHVKNNYD